MKCLFPSVFGQDFYIQSILKHKDVSGSVTSGFAFVITFIFNCHSQIVFHLHIARHNNIS